MEMAKVCRFWRRRRRRKVRRWHKHEPGKLELLLRRFRRWRRRWRRLWRQRQALMDGTAQVKAAVSDRPTTCVERTNTAAASGEAREQALTTQAPVIEVVDEVNPTPRRGPGRPCTIPTAHKCCPRPECTAYGKFGDDPLHDIVGYGTYTTVHGGSGRCTSATCVGSRFPK